MDIKKLTKPKLLELCKKFNLSTTGNKSDLIDRITHYKNRNNIYIDLIQNTAGFFVHEPTGLVFDQQSKRVYRTLRNPSLTRKDIEMCKSYGFLYILPETLDECPDRSSMAGIDLSDDSDEEDLDDDDDNEPDE